MSAERSSASTSSKRSGWDARRAPLKATASACTTRCGHPYDPVVVACRTVDPVPSSSIRLLTRDDWPEVARIYARAWRRAPRRSRPRFRPGRRDGAHLPAPRLVAELDGTLAGFLAISAVSPRALLLRGRRALRLRRRAAPWLGVGRMLLERLVAEAADLGIWTIQTSIIATNAASLALHDAVGFRTVGRRERIAQRDGVWHDTVLLELRLP